MKKIKNDTGLESIRIAGGLLSSSLLTHLRHYQLPGQKPEEYAIEKGLKLSDELGRYWRIAQARWQQFMDLQKRDDLDPHTVAVDEWLLPLLNRVLDFQLESSQTINIGERSFPITHTALNGSVPFVLTGADQPLEAGDPSFGEEGRKRSPTGLLQEYLNAEDRCLWAIVSNGLVLRLLRDNPAMTRPAYVEIDLARIFEEELYVDFTVFWLLLHATRFSSAENSPTNCILEQWRNQGQTDGERVLGELRYGVTDALRIIGTGFVAHPDNTELREAIRNEELTTEQFFQELLRLIYRFLFLFTTEDRDILLDPQADPAAQELYQQGYSTTVLRQRSRFRRHYDRYDDGWQQLLITFCGFAKGEPRLAQPALGGLFAQDQCPHLEQARLANRYLYNALFKLCYFENNRVLTRINYRDLDTEELGSVYESLLELIPRLDVSGRWHFGFLGDEADEESTTSHSRKLTGSYYTPDSLVQELIKSALEPVIKKRLEKNPGNPREALLNISVCDPACGSGHFLLAAARRLAAEFARIAAGTDQPTEADYRHALREVISRCIYGVDINPLAVELCRTALWLEAIEPGKPLGFLDAHIQIGNSLVGILDPGLMSDGIPDQAFKPLTGDDKKIAALLKKRNRKDVRQKQLFAEHVTDLAACAGDLAAMPEENLEQVELKREAWLTMIQNTDCQSEKLRADLFTTAFYAEKTQENLQNIPTNVELAAPDRGEMIPLSMRNYIYEIADEYRFFHWHLAFPEVFGRGGFDVLLGNPPWEVSQLGEVEFFATRATSISELPGVQRKKAITNLAHENPRLWQEYLKEKHSTEAANQFYRTSGRFPLSASGKINFYSLFAEHFLHTQNPLGRAGIIVPTGIATDNSTKAYFADIINRDCLASLYDFENSEAIFPGVHRSQKFSLLTLGQVEGCVDLLFFARRAEHLYDPRRHFTLTASEIKLLNPNSHTCPIFRSQADAELTKKLYRRAGIFIHEHKDESGNPWKVEFRQGLFNMASDSKLFRTRIQLEEQGATQVGADWFLPEGKRYMPLYEAKFLSFYDHRAGSYESRGDSRGYRVLPPTDLTNYNNPSYFITPYYWVPESEVQSRLTNKGWNRSWLIGWRDITAVTNERTTIAGVMPLCGVGHTLPLILFVDDDLHKFCALLANFNSLPLDYVARQKVGGTHLTYGYVKQFPLFPPSIYSSIDLDFIVSRVLELTYTSYDLKPFAQDLGYNGEPFPFAPERRHQLKCELDVYYARLYNLTRDELRYILDPADVMGEDYPSETFRVLKKKEMQEFGEYRTRLLVLEAWDKLEQGELQ